jgi:hypothetical protein
MNFIEQFMGMMFEYTEAVWGRLLLTINYQNFSLFIFWKNFEMGMQELQGVSKTQTQNTN